MNERINTIRAHLTSTSAQGVVQICGPPAGVDAAAYARVLTPEALATIAAAARTFQSRIARVMSERERRAAQMSNGGMLPDYSPATRAIREAPWTVAPVPAALLDRRCDIGDAAPCETPRLVAALSSDAQGVQCDFDDGFAPSWSNILRSHDNLNRAVTGHLPGAPAPAQLPTIMFRPRSWNMWERHMLVDGRRVPGALFDFVLYFHHNARALLALQKQAEAQLSATGSLPSGAGPFCYLPKLESALEASLWNEVAAWVEERTGVAHASIKGCVLIESITAAFEMHEILFELRERSAGLNCGMWDYAASIICRLGARPEFVFPDRAKYVSFDRHFMRCYRDLVIAVSHCRGAPATGGMIGDVFLAGDAPERRTALHAKVQRAKGSEAARGADGAIIYDLALVRDTQLAFDRVFADIPANNTTSASNIASVSHKHKTPSHQIHRQFPDRLRLIQKEDLLKIPEGAGTMDGLRLNVGVGVLFCDAWLRGHGHFVFNGCVEDSATAEISRAQVWQQIRHHVELEGTGGQCVDAVLVRRLIDETVAAQPVATAADTTRLATAATLFEEVVTLVRPPLFLTTYLDEQHPLFAADGPLVWSTVQ